MSLLLGIVGKNGAGKSIVCEYLKSQGYNIFSLSDIVRTEAKLQNLAPTRDNLVKIGNSLKKTFGADILAKRAYQKIQNQFSSNWVFDSIRNIDEINYLKSKGTIIIGIDAPLLTRFTRIQKRGKDTDLIDFETFKAHDERENSGQSSGQNINQSLQSCQIIIQNDSNLNTLYQKINTFISSLR